MNLGGVLRQLVSQSEDLDGCCSVTFRFQSHEGPTGGARARTPLHTLPRW